MSQFKFKPPIAAAHTVALALSLVALILTLPAAAQQPGGFGQPPGNSPKAPSIPPGVVPGNSPGKAPSAPPGQAGAQPGKPGAPPGFAPGASPGQPGAPPGFAPGASPNGPPGQPAGAPPGFPPGAPPPLPLGLVPVPIPIPGPTEPTNHGSNVTFDEAIAALKTGDMSYKNLYWPLSLLRKVPVDPKRREEVAALLDPVLLTESLTIRRSAQEAIEGWGTQKNIPTLLKLLEYQDDSERRHAMQALAAIGGSKEAAQALAAKMLVREDRFEAKNALAQLGTYAEDVIWQHIGSSDDTVHRYACEVLGKVGTTKSLLKLRALRRDRDSGRQRALESAQKEMEKRLVKK